ncbi:MAG: transcriptional regulator, Crp/Fnr family [Candidatus Sulfotelmatobacter sp.]|nr:transcriptional regulator, Crp/Fnr family [Candidatus Sulfotelmatobacter sp.]
MQQNLAKLFDTAAFLALISPQKKAVCFTEKQIIFSEGGPSDSIFYIQKGLVKLTVTSREGKEAIIGIFCPGDFFGESCIASDQPLRFHSAVALTEVRVMRIDRSAIIRILLEGGDACYGFVTYLLGRNKRISSALVNNLMDSSEERLARALFFLAQPGRFDSAAKVSQQTLAEMIGTTRQRVNVLIKRFKNSGLIEYAPGLKVNDSLRSIFRND